MVEQTAGSVSQGWVCAGCLTCSSAGVEQLGKQRPGSRAGAQELKPRAAGSRPSNLTKLSVLHAVPLLHFCQLVHGVSYLVP